MGGVLVMILLLISSLVLNCCSSMQVNHPRLRGNETDRLALLAVKAQIQHDPKKATSSWNESIHFCLWYGVTCSARHRQRVTKLKLGSMGLAGSISPHIGNLSFLRVLDLDNNSFTHQIPPQIGNLHRLQVLILYNNSLTGTIPPNICNCFRLTRVNFAVNNLVGKIPSQLGYLSKLQLLVVEDNNLTGEIPPSLGNLSYLEAFAITDNSLEGSIPRSLCQLKRIQGFYLGGNRLFGIIPSCIYNLSNIVLLSISDNQIQGSLPSNMGDALPNLNELAFAGNQLTGAIPRSISNATNLVKLVCSENKLTGQVPDLRNLHNLVELDCSKNKLTGQVPDLRNLHNLVIFNIGINNLGRRKQGDLNFVSDLINATRLSRLVFSYNNFGGTWPTSISNLSTNLQLLYIGGNYLQGSIPDGLGNLVNLQLLAMEENNFEGSIPTDIGKLSGLGGLSLVGNNLSGSIPSSLGNLTILEGLFLYGNNLNGSIPSSLGECHGLIELDLSQNSLEGNIPHQLLIGLLSLSISLNLSSNHLTGTLPVEIGKLKALGKLDISNNMLMGKLPSSLGSCQSLEVLHLQGNFFNGSIPSSVQDLKGIRDLDLSHNNFSGGIPQFLEHLKLEHLNLSFNQLWGAVPTGGVFKNASTTSVAGNTRLCGGIASLRLPACKSKGGGLSRKMKLMISLVSGFTLLGLAVVLSIFLLGKKRKETKPSPLGNSILQVSYATLLQATDGFSSANLIGVGAFGSVYKGVLFDGAVVAVKVLNMLHRGASKSFMAECEALRNIRHRNLVKILTACSSIDFNGNDFKALVYEFMDNGSLEEWLHPSTRTEEVAEAAKNLSLVQRLDIAIDVASALDYLHNHCETSIVHCDLKPTNVLLDSDLTGHVSDFGLSRFLSEPRTSVFGNQSSSIGIRGSVGYAAPEYGMGSEVSAHGDVYSFGILLLEMFTGKRPTDHMFSDGLNLHNYVKTTLTERVSEISESLLLQEGATNVSEARRRNSQLSVRAQKVEESLTLILGVGVACSVESPTNRKDISDATSELQSMRRNLLG